MFGVLLDFFAQIADMHHDRIVCPGIKRLAPDLLIDSRRRKDLPRMTQQEEEKCVFGVGQSHRLAMHQNGMVGRVDRNMPHLKQGSGRFFPAIDLIPAEQCLDPTDQFIGRKGFGQIIVAAVEKALQFIVLLRFGA